MMVQLEQGVDVHYVIVGDFNTRTGSWFVDDFDENQNYLDETDGVFSTLPRYYHKWFWQSSDPIVLHNPINTSKQLITE